MLAPLAFQLPADSPGLRLLIHILMGQVVEDGPNTWAPATHMGKLGGVPGSWFLLGTATTIMGIWGSEPEYEISFYTPPPADPCSIIRFSE